MSSFDHSDDIVDLDRSFAALVDCAEAVTVVFSESLVALRHASDALLAASEALEAAASAEPVATHGGLRGCPGR